jgi:hypothetical protein
MATLYVGTCGADAAMPETIAATFFGALMKGDAAKAVDDCVASNPIFKEKAQQVQLFQKPPFAAVAVSVP